MKLLGIDLETTGVDFENDRIIEIGMVLWDTDTNIPLRVFSELVYEENSPERDETHTLTSISPEMLRDNGIGPDNGNFKFWKEFSKYLEHSDYIVAHNGNKFDKIMLESFFKRYDKQFPQLPWLDTMVDIEYPQHCRSRNMIYLCGYHGFVNPFPHRALFDVMSMFKILSFYDVKKIVERSVSPMIMFKAHVGFADKDKAKAKGFMWNPDEKIWYIEFKECDVSESWLDALDFEVSAI